MLFIFSGSGGGWNTTLSLSTDFSQIWNSFKEIANRTQPTGFSSDNRYITYRGEYFSLGCDNHHGKVLKFGKFAEKF